MRMEMRLARNATPIQAVAVYQTCSTGFLLIPGCNGQKKPLITPGEIRSHQHDCGSGGMGTQADSIAFSLNLNPNRPGVKKIMPGKILGLTG